MISMDFVEGLPTVVASLTYALNGLQVPEAILQRHLTTTSSGVHTQVLIKWSNSPVALSTWEDFEAIEQKFPRAAA